MTESIYKEYQNKYYNPNDNDKRPGDNDNWKSIQKGFHDISEKQLETSAGLTLGKGTEDETSVTAAELTAMKGSGNMPYPTVSFSFVRNNTVFSSGANIIQMETGQFPVNRLSGFEPGASYVYTGHITAAEQGSNPAVAVGVIPWQSIVANDNGEITLSGTISINCIATGSFTGIVYGVLHISPVR